MVRLECRQRAQVWFSGLIPAQMPMKSGEQGVGAGAGRIDLEGSAADGHGVQIVP